MGESSFWYRPTRVVPDQRPLNGRCCCCCYCIFQQYLLYAIVLLRRHLNVLSRFITPCCLNLMSLFFCRLIKIVSNVLFIGIVFTSWYCLHIGFYFRQSDAHYTSGFQTGVRGPKGVRDGSHGVRERIPKSSNYLHGF